MKISSLTDNFTTNQNVKYSVSTSNLEDDSSSISWTSFGTGTSVSKNITLGTAYDGSTKNIYIKLKDMAGNIANLKKEYIVYKDCSQTSTTTTNGTCSATCGTGVMDVTTIKKDKYTNTQCSKTTTSNNKCTKSSCCSSTVKTNDASIYKCGSISKVDCSTSTPYREYNYEQYICTCKVASKDNKEYYSNSVSGQVHDGNTSKIYYLSDTDGRKSCAGNIADHPANYYVSRVCSFGTNPAFNNLTSVYNDKSLTGLTAKAPYLAFHGYNFYYNGIDDKLVIDDPKVAGSATIHNGPTSKQFLVGDEVTKGSKYWFHSGPSKDNRVAITESKAVACEHSCKLQKGLHD